MLRKKMQSNLHREFKLLPDPHFRAARAVLVAKKVVVLLLTNYNTFNLQCPALSQVIFVGFSWLIARQTLFTVKHTQHLLPAHAELA